MSYICKFKPVHKRVLGYFGYTLLEAQNLDKNEKQALHDRIQNAFTGISKEPAELFDEEGLIDDEEWEALEDLCSMIYWLPAHTVLVDDGNKWPGEWANEDMFAALESPQTTPRCSCEPMPICNYTDQAAIENVGYAQGILEDGMPFVAELYFMLPGTIGMNIVLPEVQQYICNKSVGKASDFPDSISEEKDNGILAIGMGYRERDDSLEELMYYTQYLEDMGIVEFTTDLQEGDLETLSDLNGNPVVLDRITLVDDDTVFAKAHLRFMPFPHGPNRFFEEEWVRDNFDGFRITELLDGLSETEGHSAIPPNCVFEDGEWRPCPYDDEVDRVFRPSKED